MTELFENNEEFGRLAGFLSNETHEIETENNSNVTGMRWTKEVNKIAMKCFYKVNDDEDLERNRIIRGNRKESCSSK